jgi:hypothetical protein
MALGDQHAVPVDVAGGEDVRDARTQVVVDYDVAAVDRRTSVGAVDEVGVAGPAHCKEGGVGLDGRRLVAHPVDDPNPRAECLPFDGGAGHDLDAPPAKGLLKRGRDILVRARDDPRGVFDERAPAAEVGQDRGELAARVGRTDHADPAGQGGQAAYVLVGEAELGAGDRQPPGAPADGDDHPVGVPGPAVTRGDGVGVEEARVSGLFGEVDPHRAYVLGDAPALVGVVRDPLGIGQRGGEVHLGSRPAQAERLPRAPVPHEARRAGQGAHGCGTAVESRAAESVPLDERDLGPQLGGVQRRGRSGGAASEDENAHLRPLPR